MGRIESHAAMEAGTTEYHVERERSCESRLIAPYGIFGDTEILEKSSYRADTYLRILAVLLYGMLRSLIRVLGKGAYQDSLKSFAPLLHLYSIGFQSLEQIVEPDRCFRHD